MSEHELNMLSKLIAEHEIRQLMYRWIRSVDRRDWSSMRDIFHPDAVDNHGSFNGGVDGLIEYLKKRHKDIPQSFHMIGNMLIEFVNDHRALVETYVIAHQRYPSSNFAGRALIVGEEKAAENRDLDTMITARYIDVMERRNGEWRVFRRDVVFDSMIVHMDGFYPLGPGKQLAGRALDDALWRAREAEGLPMPSDIG